MESVEFLELGTCKDLEEVVFVLEGFDVELGGYLGGGELGVFDLTVDLAESAAVLGDPRYPETFEKVAPT